MDASTIAVIIAIASFIGTYLVPLVTAQQAREERREVRRRERLDYYMAAEQSLIQLRARLQDLQGARTATTESHEREVAYGEAFAILLSIPNPEIRSLAEGIMSGQWIDKENQKLKPINEALVLLGDLIDAIMREKT